VKILLTGRNGQVGRELERSLAALGELVAFDRRDLDLADPDQLVSRVRELGPQLIVNAAAYTAVDSAEGEVQQAMAINATAPGILAEEASRLGACLVHYSTDYVFDGNKRSPYTEEDTPNPANVYGRSKLAGEEAIQASGCRHLILRTAWVYSSHGQNFLLTMLRLAGEKPELRVVDDQIGAPTWARDIANATASMLGLATMPEGLFHLTAAGQTSWCGFARAIFRIRGLQVPVLPIASSDFPTPAARPAFSVLDNSKLTARTGISMRDWERALADCLRDFAAF
jgi:dTDP-4-dehydrorhamnose reductase